jgi:hypothetical protein
MKFKKYLLKEGDTIDSMSVKLNKSKQEIRNFHNVYCKNEELISMEIPPGLKYLYISTAFDVEELDNIPKVSFESNSVLKFNPKLIKNNYGVQIQNFNNGKLTYQLHYEIEIQCISNNNQKPIFKIVKTQSYINNHEPDLIFEKLIDEISKVIYPINIATDAFGMIDEVANYDEIKKKWTKKMKDFSEYYSGKTTENILVKINRLINDYEEFKNSLNKNWFYCIFFSPLYISYAKNYCSTVHKSYPIFGNNAVKYEAVQTINKYLSETQKVIIIVKGKATDERTVGEIKNGYNYPKAKIDNKNATSIESIFEIQYKLHAETHHLFSAVAIFETKTENDSNKINKIEIFDLNA